MKSSTTLLVTCSTVFLAQLGMSIYLPALPEMARYLSAEASQVSWGLAVYLIGMALPMLFWGSLAQRIGRKPVLLAALAIYGLGNLALPLGQTLESFLFFRLVQGIGASGISVMARVLIRDSFRGDLLAKALSWLSISFVVALGIGQYLGSIIQVTLGWPAICYWRWSWHGSRSRCGWKTPFSRPRGRVTGAFCVIVPSCCRRSPAGWVMG